MLSRRLLSAFLLIPLLIASVLFSQGKGCWIAFIVAHLMVGFSLKEYFTLAQKKGIQVIAAPGIALGLVVSALIYWGTFFNYLSAEKEIFLLFLIVGIVFLFQALQKMEHSPLVTSAVTLTGIFYIAWLFSFVYKILFYPGLDGRFFVFFAFLVTKSSDIMAYFVGSLIGRHPLAPTVSPKKTIEGAVGGVLGSIGAAYLGQALFFPNLSLPHLFLFGLIVGLVGMVGDLLESMFKRDAKVKDSGQFIPGMGGALDVLDSLFFTLPVTYFYMKFFLG